MEIKKYLLFSGGAVVFSSAVAYRVWNLTKPSVATSLAAEGRRTIFDSAKPKFEKWIKLYLTFKEELISKNIVSADHINDKEGAFVFKNWCANSLKSNSGYLLDLARNYCTMTLGVYALEQEGVELIEDVKVNRNQKEVWFSAFTNHKDEIIKSGLFGDLIGDDQDKSGERVRGWCRRKAKEPYIPKNYKIAGYLSSWCVVKKR
ncbi:hypothetical protein A6V39_00825 [Candidatus Mycoplasma haematobovis]|uniref:Uncharacterized protein n=1 Tax=Candidatus Mycoplasma haematobovis TaxID=432608 RepID=A0A1A9QF57_9MOLU|nr:hypothetical protein [Candidatus Mycoplasma haematobovis]OAL10595.1 hypothetical protein A6V39_00825 [Candidatus Mycoplasma haematobovis]